jgi:hypothetical protein
VNPPRAAYLDFPLGHTAGKPHQIQLNRAILRDALAGFESLLEPGALILRYEWDTDDGWKDGVMRPRAATAEHGDQRVERAREPQYQNAADRALAEQALASGGCTTCIWLE